MDLCLTIVVAHKFALFNDVRLYGVLTYVLLSVSNSHKLSYRVCLAKKKRLVLSIIMVNFFAKVDVFFIHLLNVPYFSASVVNNFLSENICLPWWFIGNYHTSIYWINLEEEIWMKEVC